MSNYQRVPCPAGSRPTTWRSEDYDLALKSFAKAQESGAPVAPVAKPMGPMGPYLGELPWIDHPFTVPAILIHFDLFYDVDLEFYDQPCGD